MNDNDENQDAVYTAEAEQLLDAGESSRPREISGWTLLMTNLILEIASAVFDQMGYAQIGMVLAFVALLLAAVELIHIAPKERIKWAGKRQILPLFFISDQLILPQLESLLALLLSILDNWLVLSGNVFIQLWSIRILVRRKIIQLICVFYLSFSYFAW
ncbi:PREDICTED: uncharacterized protein LOC105142350 [Populus euphratica]|uniref:Uncharacterized protein LOC105142350 n=1 Tax=Populus euphratica TaxID=75702 RepID=A0AAJ6VH01_POPEU|nr:PREDICTED: uncharacterized protein LOC105142350 [Populus euphratica]